MTPRKLSELVETWTRLSEAATAGPWFFDSYAKIFHTLKELEDTEDFYIARVPCFSGDTATNKGHRDAQFIAAARSLPSEIIERQRQVIEALTTASRRLLRVQGAAIFIEEEEHVRAFFLELTEAMAKCAAIESGDATEEDK